MTWKQSLIHAIEWRLIAVVIDFCVILIMTGEIVLSLAASSASAFVRTVAHAVWVKIKFKRTQGEVY